MPGYDVGQGAADFGKKYGDSPEADAYLAVSKGIKTGDINAELKKSHWRLVTTVTGDRSGYRVYVEDAIRDAAQQHKGNLQVLETLAKVGVVPRSELGLPEATVDGPKSIDMNPPQHGQAKES